ncbi:hypothetical protein ABK040_011566 [Willaertia magna]
MFDISFASTFPLFQNPKINQLKIKTLNYSDYNKINNNNKTPFENYQWFILSITYLYPNHPLQNLNQIITLTLNFNEEFILIYEANNKLYGMKMKEINGINNIIEEFNLPKDSDIDKEIYFLQFKKTKQVFVKDEYNILELYNNCKIDNNGWKLIEDKRLQNIKFIKTNCYTTLFYLEDGKVFAYFSNFSDNLIEIQIENEEIQKVDLHVEGILILTKNNKIYCLSKYVDQLQTFQNYICKSTNYLNNLILIELIFDFKVLNLFTNNFGVLFFVKDEIIYLNYRGVTKLNCLIYFLPF